VAIQGVAAISREIDWGESMVSAPIPGNGRLQAQTISDREQLAPEAVWIDLEKPSAEQLRWVEAAYDQKLPSMDELIEIEANSRIFRDDGGLHVRTYFLHAASQRPYNVTVGFILKRGRVFTLSDEALASFQQYRRTLESQRGAPVDAFGIMLGLFELKVDPLADLLEQLHIESGGLNERVFHAEERDFEQVLTLLATIQDRNDRTRRSLMDKQRGMSFLPRGSSCPDQRLPLLR
jgi:magnesium transporter